MNKHTEILKRLSDQVLSSHRRKITGRNKTRRDLFRFLLSEEEPKAAFLALLDADGLILDCVPEHGQLAGCTLSLSFSDLDPELEKWKVGSDAVILALSEETEHMEHFAEKLKRLFMIMNDGMSMDRRILSSLDFAEDTICVYDREAYLLYGNRSFCRSMNIPDREQAIGMHLQDILQYSKIRLRPSGRSATSMKTLDVLKHGKKILNWEVKIESVESPNDAHLVTDNIYPILSERGETDGIVEIGYTHRLNLNNTRRIMGFSAEYTFDSILGESTAIRELKKTAMEYAESPFNLLIVGESGVGKELFAQAVHNQSSRRNGPFVAVNCASLPENLVESELFGYVGGAFTGASRNGQIGKFELANGGTIFLDEIGELPLHFQPKLLRVLETRKVSRIGSPTQMPLDIRVICATNRNLRTMIAEGFFREDLHYRLQVLTLFIPPLRERKEDILLMISAFFRQAAQAEGKDPLRLTPEAERVLLSYDWPGNVRELRNAAYRASVLSRGSVVTRKEMEDAVYARGYGLRSRTDGQPERQNNKGREQTAECTLGDAALPDPSPEDPQVRLDRIRSRIDEGYRDLVNEALSISHGNKKQAAALLGISRKTIYRMIEKYCCEDS